jgi:hypothetical protein
MMKYEKYAVKGKVKQFNQKRKKWNSIITRSNKIFGFIQKMDGLNPDLCWTRTHNSNQRKSRMRDRLKNNSVLFVCKCEWRLKIECLLCKWSLKNKLPLCKWRLKNWVSTL